MDALQRGDARTARVAFEKILAADLADASICLALAYACRGLQDTVGAIDAVNRALQHEPQNLRALIFKADALTQIGDARAAAAFYRAAVKLASPSDAVPTDLRDDVARARMMCDRFAGQFENFLRDRLTEIGRAHV